MRSQISTASVEGVDFVFSMDNKIWFWNRTERWFNDLNCQIDSLMALSFHYTLAANLDSWCCFRCDWKVLEFWWLLRKCLMRHFGIHSSKELSSFSCVFLNPGFFWSIFGYPKNAQPFFLTLVETSDIVEFHQKALQESLDHRDSCFPLLTDCRFAEF